MAATPIAFDKATSGGSTSAALSGTVSIGTAAVGAIVFACIQLGAAQTSMTMTGWNQLESADTNTGSHHGIFWRQMVAGDTSFTVSWPTSTKHRWGWVSYTGLDPLNPIEGYTPATHSTTGSTAFATGSGTATDDDRWALCAYYVTSTTAGSFSWSVPKVDGVAASKRLDSSNAGTSPFTGLTWIDTNGTVSQASHSGTVTLSQSEANGGGTIMFLVPNNRTYDVPRLRLPVIQSYTR